MPDDTRMHFTEALGPTPDCPSIEDLVLLIEGKRGEESQRQIEAHVSHCAYCETELAMYREFVAPEERPEERPHVAAIVERLRKNPPVARASWWTRLWNVRVLAPASLALAAAAIAIVLLIPRQPIAPIVSTVDDSLRSGTVTLIAPLGSIQSAPGMLEWEPVKGAARYKVTVEEVDNTPIWAGESTTANLQTPTEVKIHISPLKTLKWKVSAISSTGTVLADSAAQTFRLAR